MKKIVIIVVAIVLLIAVAGGAAWFFLMRPSDDEPKKEALPTTFEFALGEQYTNIKVGEGETRKTILKYSPVVQFTDEDYRSVVEQNKTVIINEMRKYFMNRTADQLTQLDRVQEDLRDLVIQELRSDPTTISNVLFLEFITQ
ncbi:MAG: hypothetical protein CSA13_00205 [Clostridiales bacterium]|nr:MAG: hypothetical protein CSA13_00205 [Clostridiales bacterium]